MFISLCLSSFHSESSDHSLGPVEGSFAPPGGWGHPPLRVRLWLTLAAQFNRGGVFVDLFRRALNLMALEVRCA